jgi:hypothetical protein
MKVVIATDEESRELSRQARRRQRDILFVRQSKGEALRGGFRDKSKAYARPKAGSREREW